MIPKFLSPLANHLWQSTVIVGLAALLALALRTNSARIRYWLWLLVATKFLIPFSLLVSIGHQFEWKVPPAVTQRPVSAVAKISMPFVVMPVVTVPPPTMPTANPLPAISLFVWLCGFAISVWFWMRSWWRVHAALRAATLSYVDLPENKMSVRVMSCPSLIEPAVFGIFKPLLLLPDGISRRLTQDQLKSVLIHELCHIRRRDNLATAFYMVVETLFWFYPLVRWIGKRLMEERERACDEEVLSVNVKPDIYVEGILKVCQFYLESSPTCAAGVMGSNLKIRVEAILRNRVPADLNFGKRLFLAGTGAAVVVLPIILGALGASSESVAASIAQTQALPDWQAAAGGKMAFEVASVKPDKGPARAPLYPLDNGKRYKPGDRLSAALPVNAYIQFAYKVRFSARQYQFIFDHFPWLRSDLYAIEAKAPALASKDQMRLMMQSLLAERFHLVVHFETQETDVMVLKLVKPGQTGPKLQAHSEGICEGETAQGRSVDISQMSPGRCYQTVFMPPNGQRAKAFARDVTMGELADAVTTIAGDRPVVDQTGLPGGIDFEMEWMVDPSSGAPLDATSSSDPGLPTFLEALREQLGLKLESSRVPLRVLVIDHIDRPSEN